MHRGRNRDHPTRDALLQSAVELLDTNPADQVTMESVLVGSGISKGSLYHFFRDFTDLIDQAQIIRFARFVDVALGGLAAAILNTQSKEEFLVAIKQVTSSTRGNVAIRSDWIWALGQATSRPEFREMLGAEQQRLTDGLADLVRVLQERGWFRSELDPSAISVLIQSYTIGKFVNDITPSQVEDEDWRFLLDSVIERTFMA